jgi:hypothetical protein
MSLHSLHCSQGVQEVAAIAKKPARANILVNNVMVYRKFCKNESKYSVVSNK